MARPHIRPHEEQEESARLLEQAFIAGFRTAADPASFLRLARVPQELARGDDMLRLLEVKIVERTVVGAVTPGFGTRQLVYHPFPSALTSTTSAAVLVYCGEAGIRELAWADVMAGSASTRERKESAGAG
jgi:hypothetical protein